MKEIDLSNIPDQDQDLQAASKQLQQYLLQQLKRKNKLEKKDPNLVIKEKKAKRRLSNKSRKINQAKGRHNKFTR